MIRPQDITYSILMIAAVVAVIYGLSSIAYGDKANRPAIVFMLRDKVISN